MTACAGLVLAPIAALVRIAFDADAEIWAHLAVYVLPGALANTVLLLAGVAAVTLVIGVGTAWMITAFEFPGRSACLWLLPLPLAIPIYIMGYVYVDVFDALGPTRVIRQVLGWKRDIINMRSLGGAIFVMGFALYPYVYLAARAMFQTQGAALIEMARTTGAGPWRVARDIVLPLARPAIVAGLSLALLETLNDIGVSEYLGVQTLTLSIFTTWLNRGSLAGAAQIACVMLVAVAGLFALERAGRRSKRFVGIDQQFRPPARLVLAGPRRWLAAAACALPIAVGFGIPAAFLAHEVITRGLLVGFDTALARHALTTVMLASAATVATIALGLSAAVAARLARSAFVLLCVGVAGIGYAVPGTVLALGLLAPLVGIDEAINWLTRAVAGTGVGLIIAGSGAAVVIAYVIRFLAISIGFGQAGLARISSELDDAARTAGARPAGLVRSIHLPLLRPALWGAALLVFVDCLKELPATLILRPLNVETLSTYTYQFATRGNFEEGALAALLIVAVGLPAVIYMAGHADAPQRAAPFPEQTSSRT